MIFQQYVDLWQDSNIHFVVTNSKDGRKKVEQIYKLDQIIPNSFIKLDQVIPNSVIERDQGDKVPKDSTVLLVGLLLYPPFPIWAF